MIAPKTTTLNLPPAADVEWRCSAATACTMGTGWCFQVSHADEDRLVGLA